MNILVIGNGFDLAHELPTRYTDFLKFVKVIRKLFGDEVYDFKNIINGAELSDQIKEILKEEVGGAIIPYLDKNWEKWLASNVWIDFFLQSNYYQKDDWIDFESEISRVIQVLDIIYKRIGKSDLFDKFDSELFIKIGSIRPKFISKIFRYLRERYISNSIKKCIKSIIKYIRTMEQHPHLSDVKQILEVLKIEEKLFELIKNEDNGKYYEDAFYRMIVDKLNNDYKKDLNNLIVAFEKYLYIGVSKIEIIKVSPDIKAINVDKVISFNYTRTYEKVYENNSDVEYDYIHGKIGNGNNNNMVLGIDEYLLNEKRNIETDFIDFKKYYQRIYKLTDSNYKDWIDEIRNSTKEIEDTTVKHNLYIFGHSLDVTDGDVLRDLILNDNVYTTVYYPDTDELGRKITNLVKVIGQDELIKRTGGRTKTIEFKLQKPIGQIIFEDIMSSGVILSNYIEFSSIKKSYPDYLQVDQVIYLSPGDKLNPSNLSKKSALVYNTNLYITDENGNIAYFDCDMQHTDNAGQIRKQHQEYKSVGGKEALHPDMDAGHFGLALGQHPSIAMEQHKHTNRYGAWRKFEIDWNNLSSEGHKVNIKAVFVEGDEEGTYSPFWCIRETIDGDEDGASEYVITNDDLQ